jgi:3-phenylpropionate/trans-cinnamate dioxygenase ferredoxin reductase subunit
MAKLHKISLGTESFHARSGQVLLDAALLHGVDLPHDCRAGRCGSCLTKITRGITLGGETRQSGVVHACQARIFSDLALEIEALPPVEQIRGKIARLVDLADDIVEISIAPERKVDILPGQYCLFTFRGFPARPFSPTSSMRTTASDGLIRLHVKRVRDGRVTPQLGKTILPKHPVTIEGPYGHAFLRPNLTNRIVLLGSGTGFAPIWAVAAAALRENPSRSIVLMAASRKISSCYMAPALELASRGLNVKAKATIEELKADTGVLKAGRALDHLPTLHSTDIVYAAGAPALVDALGETAVTAGATFYADPFEPLAPPSSSRWLDMAKGWLRAG